MILVNSFAVCKLKVVFLPIFPVHQSSWLKFAQWWIELNGLFPVYLHPFLSSLSWKTWFRKAGSLF